MFSITNARARLAPILVAVAIAAVLAACSAGGAAPAPTDPPAPAPTAVPAPITPAPASPAPAPTPEVEDPGSDLLPIHVELDSTSGQSVSVDILDRTGFIESAISGQPGGGPIVEPYTVQVENLDAHILRLSWTDFPIDNALALYVDPNGASLRFVLVQPAPTGEADAMGEGRILDLTFDRDVSAAQVEAFLQEGLDTPG